MKETIEGILLGLGCAVFACGSLAIVLALIYRLKKPVAPMPPVQWFKCLECGVFESTDGQQCWRPPIPSYQPINGRLIVRGYPVRECRDCKAAAKKLAEVAK